MNQKQHGRNAVQAGWQQVQSQPFEASQQAELQRPVNRSYKDTLFRMLFQEKEALLSLYNAVGQTDYKDASQLEIVTLENAIYMNMKNDLAFLINLELNLYEHQSTWNPNMPLRDLFYVAKEYEQLIRKETLYSSRLVKLPVPRFLVFCNGRMPDQAEKIVLKLSDSFEKRTGEPELELKVTVLNINAGCNETLMNACRLLKEYSLYVARVRSYASQMDMNTAVNRAVEECISEGILADFLLKSRAEVVAMSIFEYDEEREPVGSGNSRLCGCRNETVGSGYGSYSLYALVSTLDGRNCGETRCFYRGRSRRRSVGRVHRKVADTTRTGCFQFSERWSSQYI